MPYSEILKFTLPDDASSGQTIEFYVSAQLTSSPPEWSNFVIAIEYTDGPLDALPVLLMGSDYWRIPKGSDARWAFPLPAVGQEVTLFVRIPGISAGVYTITAKVGHINESWEEDARQTKQMTILQAPSEPTPSDTYASMSSLISSIMMLMLIFMLMTVMRTLLE